MITCPRCGYQAPDGSPYCPRCGYGKVPQQQPIRQDPLPERPEPAKKKSKDIPTSWVIIMAMAIVMLMQVIGRLSADQQVRQLQQTVTSQAGALAALQQTSTAFAAAPTSTPQPTATPAATQAAAATLDDDIPALCKDPQLDLIRLAEVLDADGFPHPEDYNELNESCVYRIADTDSWLNTGSFGELYLFFEDGRPYMANLAISYKDSDQIREVIRDWGAVAVSYIDPDTNILDAQSVIVAAASSGSAETDNIEATAMLHTEGMLYRIIVRDKSILE